MTGYTIVTDDGFADDDWQEGDICHLNGDDDPLEAIARSKDSAKVIITFGGVHDGRGFSLARQLRESGFSGHLRAKGALITDQWRHLRQTGFDSLMLSPEQVEKMPLQAWRDVQDIHLPNYQRRIFGGGDSAT
jgi:uncharacterized protein (DUF934 family)